MLLAKHRPLFHSAIPGITGTTGFPGEERVLIDINGDSRQAEELKDTIKKLERVTGLKIDVRPNMPKSVNAEYAVGGALQSNNSYCTSGFNVAILAPDIAQRAGTHPNDRQGTALACPRCTHCRTSARRTGGSATFRSAS